MKAYIPKILQFVGLLLLAFGVYQLILPEASLNHETSLSQNQTDNYVTMLIGLVSIALGFFMNKKNK